VSLKSYDLALTSGRHELKGGGERLDRRALLSAARMIPISTRGNFGAAEGNRLIRRVVNPLGSRSAERTFLILSVLRERERERFFRAIQFGYFANQIERPRGRIYRRSSPIL